MKKLIAISVVFALVLGAAFAQPNIGGGLSVGTKILKGQTQHETDQKVVNAGGMSWDDRNIDISGGDADAGAKIRIKSHESENQHWLAWWKPIPQLKIMLGGWDGEWGHQDIGGWGFDATAKNPGVSMNMYWEIPPLTNVSWNNGAWAGGINKALFISLYPMDALEVNLGIPVWENDGAWQNVYGNMYLDAKFNLDGIGKVMVAFQFHPTKHDRSVASIAESSGAEEPEYHWRKSRDEAHNPMQAWLGFNLSAIENLGVELGLGFTLPYTTQEQKYVSDNTSWTKIQQGAKVNVGGVGYDGNPTNAKVIAPVNVGLGAKYAISEDFEIKARAGFKFGGKVRHDREASDKLFDEKYAYGNTQFAYQQSSIAYTNRTVTDPNGNLLFPGTPSTAPAMYKTLDYSYLKSTELELGSSTFYVKETTKTFSGSYAPGNEPTTRTLVDDVNWVAKTGTQEKKRDPFQWGLNVKPSYKIGNITANLNLGIGMKHYLKQEVRVQKTELVTNYDGETQYVKVYEKKNDNQLKVYDNAIALAEAVPVTGNAVADAARADAIVAANRSKQNAFYTDGFYYANSKPVYETITFEGKPGLYTKETSIDYARTPAEKKTQADLFDNVVKVDLDWFVNPYIELPVGGGGTFFAGVKVWTDGERKPIKYNYSAQNATYGVGGAKVGTIDTAKGPVNVSSTKYKVKWEIPIGFNFGF